MKFSFSFGSYLEEKNFIRGCTAHARLAHQHQGEILGPDEQPGQAGSAEGTLGEAEIDGGSNESLSPQSQIPDRALALRSRHLGTALLRLKRGSGRDLHPLSSSKQQHVSETHLQFLWADASWLQ